MQTFLLDLKTLLQILARQKQYGFLQAGIPAEKFRNAGSRQVLHAHLLLAHGQVQSCSIVRKSGEPFAEGQQALQLLLGVGSVEWQWKASTPSSQLSPSQAVPDHRVPAPHNGRHPSSFAAFVPQRTARSEAALATLPREYRKVLALVDGQRSVHMLANILAIEEDDVMAALRMLQSRGLIS